MGKKLLIPMKGGQAAVADIGLLKMLALYPPPAIHPGSLTVSNVMSILRIAATFEYTHRRGICREFHEIKFYAQYQFGERWPARVCNREAYVLVGTDRVECRGSQCDQRRCGYRQ